MINIYHHIRTFVAQHAITGERAQWGLFVFFGSVMFFTVCIGHWFVYHTFMFSALWEQPAAFWGFILPKVSITLFLALFVLLTHRKWWTAVVLACSNIWIIANILYYRANNCVLTGEAMLMANNLQGFESSIGFYWNNACTFLLLFTLIYAISLLFFHPQPADSNTAVKRTVIAITLGIVVSTFAGGVKLFSKSTLSNYESPSCYIPFYLPQEARYTKLTTPSHYATQHSLVAYLPYLLSTTIVDACTQEEVIISPIEQQQLAPFFHKDSIANIIRPDYNLIFLLIESFETFALEATDVNGEYLLPNFRSLISHENTLYADKITSQALHGVSADGQMILNTGLLPLRNKVAAMVYGTNVYPNYAHFYDRSILFNPYFAATWNQVIVTSSYGYKTLQSNPSSIRDEETFNRLNDALRVTSPDSTFCYLVLTVDSHSPFDRVVPNPTLAFDANMPQMLQDYLTCLHYTDSCFGVWYNEWRNTEQATHTVLVITGDHTIFKDATLKELQPYATRTGLSIAAGQTYCPLIVQAPQIRTNKQITDICYQMDVYPTIMHVIGCEDYAWKGFGVNLLDFTQTRPIAEEDAYRLSDILIRSNYFQNHFE